VTHVRTRVRAAARAALAAALPAMAARIGAVRIYARNKDDLPAIEVSTPGERVEWLADDTLGRTITLVVMIHGLGETVEDDLDAIAETVEAALLEGLPPPVSQVVTTGSEFDSGDAGESRAARLAVTFECLVLADRDNPQAI
jgi:hypothetical protein